MTLPLYTKLEKISKQTKLWLWYGRLSPLFFLVAAVAMYQIVYTTVPFMLYASWVIFISTSIVWWGWVIKVIMEIVNMFSTVLHLLKELKVDIKDVQAEIKKLEEPTRKD